MGRELRTRQCVETKGRDGEKNRTKVKKTNTAVRHINIIWHMNHCAAAAAIDEVAVNEGENNAERSAQAQKESTNAAVHFEW